MIKTLTEERSLLSRCRREERAREIRMGAISKSFPISRGPVRSETMGPEEGRQKKEGREGRVGPLGGACGNGGGDLGKKRLKGSRISGVGED